MHATHHPWDMPTYVTMVIAGQIGLPWPIIAGFMAQWAKLGLEWPGQVVYGSRQSPQCRGHYATVSGKKTHAMLCCYKTIFSQQTSNGSPIRVCDFKVWFVASLALWLWIYYHVVLNQALMAPHCMHWIYQHNDSSILSIIMLMRLVHNFHSAFHCAFCWIIW